MCELINPVTGVVARFASIAQALASPQWAQGWQLYVPAECLSDSDTDSEEEGDLEDIPANRRVTFPIRFLGPGGEVVEISKQQWDSPAARAYKKTAAPYWGGVRLDTSNHILRMLMDQVRQRHTCLCG